LRRLFSTFATGLPGAGLLVMRLVAGVTLVLRAIGGLSGDLVIGPAPLLVLQIGPGLLLLAGLWTPVAGTLVAIIQVLYLFLRTGDPWIHVLLGTLGAALALLGPGAWSVDARLFGWKRIDIRDRQSHPQVRPERWPPEIPPEG
jgi:putative oxidoreductase